MLKLNLGCGNKKKEDFINVDCVHEVAPDVVLKLDQVGTRWPWEDGSVDEVLMCHSLEHMGQTTEAFFHVIKELYRVCANGAKVRVIVPHERSSGFTGDPTHVRIINIPVMSLFSKEECRKSREKGFPNTPLAEYINVDFRMYKQEYSLFPGWHQRLQKGEITEEELYAAIDTYFNVVCEVDMEFLVVKE